MNYELIALDKIVVAVIAKRSNPVLRKGINKKNKSLN